jgi:hypothetical protein
MTMLPIVCFVFVVVFSHVISSRSHSNEERSGIAAQVSLSALPGNDSRNIAIATQGTVIGRVAGARRGRTLAEIPENAAFSADDTYIFVIVAASSVVVTVMLYMMVFFLTKMFQRRVAQTKQQLQAMKSDAGCKNMVDSICSDIARQVEASSPTGTPLSPHLPATASAGLLTRSAPATRMLVEATLFSALESPAAKRFLEADRNGRASMARVAFSPSVYNPLSPSAIHASSLGAVVEGDDEGFMIGNQMNGMSSGQLLHGNRGRASLMQGANGVTRAQLPSTQKGNIDRTRGGMPASAQDVRLPRDVFQAAIASVAKGVVCFLVEEEADKDLEEDSGDVNELAAIPVVVEEGWEVEATTARQSRQSMHTRSARVSMHNGNTAQVETVQLASRQKATTSKKDLGRAQTAKELVVRKKQNKLERVVNGAIADVSASLHPTQQAEALTLMPKGVLLDVASSALEAAQLTLDVMIKPENFNLSRLRMTCRVLSCRATFSQVVKERAVADWLSHQRRVVTTPTASAGRASMLRQTYNAATPTPRTPVRNTPARDDMLQKKPMSFPPITVVEDGSPERKTTRRDSMKKGPRASMSPQRRESMRPTNARDAGDDSTNASSPRLKLRPANTGAPAESAQAARDFSRRANTRMSVVPNHAFMAAPSRSRIRN